MRHDCDCLAFVFSCGVRLSEVGLSGFRKLQVPSTSCCFDYSMKGNFPAYIGIAKAI